MIRRRDNRFMQGFAENTEKIEVKTNKEMIIALESFGQIDAKSIFTKSIEALKKDLS